MINKHCTKTLIRDFLSGTVYLGPYNFQQLDIKNPCCLDYKLSECQVEINIDM